ncbi:MAG: TetR family transcriptional regulator [Acidimicrobiales bacterium]|nr:TetR family transcriptional regulator [Acidimicrobiales bacterium]
MTARGERTREHLLDVAERLFGERGVDAVSLREIRIAAGQRNASALQFHFGDRDGLLRALADRHLPRLAETQLRLLEQTKAEGRERDPLSLVEVLIRPTAEYVAAGPSARAWLKIAAELAARPERRFDEFANGAPRQVIEAGGRLVELMAERMPLRLAVERLLAVSQAMLHISADRARFEDAAQTGRTGLPFDAWVENVVNMAYGAVMAPVTPVTHRDTLPARP